MSHTDVIVHSDSDLLTAAAANRLITRLVDAQLVHGVATVVLTGGGTGIAMLEQVRSSPAREAVDWNAVNVVWGDERFLPQGDPERNETQARKALLDHVDVAPSRVHPMASSDGNVGGKVGGDADEAAAHYAEVLATLAEPAADVPVPRFDVLLLGIGEEGHTASLFPETPYVRETARTTVGVHNCPKPPPTRISLTLPAICSASEVWLVVSGAAKADAVAKALAGTAPTQLPAAGAQGRDRTLWLLDSAAASSAELP